MNPEAFASFDLGGFSGGQFYITTEDPARLKQTIVELTRTVKRLEGEHDAEVNRAVNRIAELNRQLTHKNDRQQECHDALNTLVGTERLADTLTNRVKAVVANWNDLFAKHERLQERVDAQAETIRDYQEQDRNREAMEEERAKVAKAKDAAQNFADSLANASAQITVANLVSNGSLSPSYKGMTASAVIRNLVDDLDAARKARDEAQAKVVNVRNGDHDIRRKIVAAGFTIWGLTTTEAVEKVLETLEIHKNLTKASSEATAAYSVLQNLAQQYNYDYDGDTRSLVSFVANKKSEAFTEELVKLRTDLARLRGKLVNIRINFGLEYEPNESALDLADRLFTASAQVKSDLVQTVKRLAGIDAQVERVAYVNAELRRAIERYDSRAEKTIGTFNRKIEANAPYEAWALKMDLPSHETNLAQAREIVKGCTENLTN